MPTDITLLICWIFGCQGKPALWQPPVQELKRPPTVVAQTDQRTAAERGLTVPRRARLYRQDIK